MWGGEYNVEGFLTPGSWLESAVSSGEQGSKIILNSLLVASATDFVSTKY